MSHSTKKSKRQKPTKPHADFPLTPHRNGQWCKKVKGQVHFFGVWEDPDAALECWLEDKDALLAGRERPSRMEEGETVEGICVAYLAHQESRFESGELERISLSNSSKACSRLCKILGKTTKVESLTPKEFRNLRTRLAKKYNPNSLKVEIQRVKAPFRYAYENGLIQKPVRFGTEFSPPSKKSIQKNKNQKGDMSFAEDEIARLLSKADPIMRAFILLGLNCGFGNHDVAMLDRKAIDFNSGWIDFPRVKNERPRRCPLWSETIEALKAAKSLRAEPKDDEYSDLVFLTKGGMPWVRAASTEKGEWVDCIGKPLRKLMRDCDAYKRGRNFYGFRKTFRTVADETLDFPAIDLIMGHSPDTSDMSQHYRERISDDRLLAVTKHVHKWLFGRQRAKK